MTNLFIRNSKNEDCNWSENEKNTYQMKLFANYKNKKFIHGVLLSLTLFGGAVIASPTISEFDQCKNISVAMLEYCIKGEPYNDNKSCWTRSQNSYEKCYRDVFKGHSRDIKLKRLKKREVIKKHSELIKNKKVAD